MSILDYSIIIVYFIVSILIGYVLEKSQQKFQTRSLSWLPIALSIIASQISAVTFIGAPGWAYVDGLSMLVFNLTIPLGLWCSGNFLLPYFYKKNYVSVYEFLTERFGQNITKLISVAFIFKSIVVAGVVIYAPALIIKELTGISQYISILILSTIAILYTYYGGIKAVIWTDVFQMVVLWGAIIGILVLLMQKHGNIIEILTYSNDHGKLNAFRIPEQWYMSNTFFTGIVGGTIFHTAYFGTDQVQVQRMLTAKDSKNLQCSLWFSSIWSIIQMCAFILIGFYLFKVYQGTNFSNPNQIIIKFIQESIPSGLFGLVIAAILAAVMSSLDSLINSMATVTAVNIVCNNEDKTIKKWIVIWGIVIAIASILFGEIKIPLLEAISKYGSYLLGSIFGIFILGIFFKKIQEREAVISFFVTIIILALLAKFTPMSWMLNVLAGSLVSVVISHIFFFLMKGKENTSLNDTKMEFQYNALWVPIIITLFSIFCYILPNFF